MSEEMLCRILRTDGYIQQVNKHAVYDYIKELQQQIKILEDNYKGMDKFHKDAFLNRSEYIEQLEQQLSKKEKIIDELKEYLHKEIDTPKVGGCDMTTTNMLATEYRVNKLILDKIKELEDKYE